jgi:MbtH protein
MAEARSDWQDGLLKVVVNQEQQYSVWPAERKPPAGWQEAGKIGHKEDCLNYIAEVWRDMRPLSISG